MPANILDLSKNGTQSVAFITDQKTLAIVQSGKAIELDRQQLLELYFYTKDHLFDGSESSFKKVGAL